MTTIKNLVDGNVAEALQRMAADSGGTVLVGDAAQMGQCEFCHEDVVLAGPPVPGTLVSCKECAKDRVGGGRAQVARRPRTTKHQPRLVPTPEEQASAEARMVEAPGAILQRQPMPTGRVDAKQRPVHSVNVGALSDAELGRMVRSGLLSLVVEGAPTSKAKADLTSDEALAELRRLLVEERSQRTVLAGFTCRTIDVPPLDLTDVIWDVLVTSRIRSPYNKLRYRLSEPLLDPETTTYRALIAEHLRLSEVVDVAETKEVLAAGRQAAEQYQGTMTALAGGEPEFTTTTMTKKAKIEALVETLGISKAEAKRMVEALG